MPSDQRLVLAIIDYLNAAIEDGSVKADDKEGLEIAIQCIGEAFGVDPSNQDQANDLAIKPASLQSIFDVFLKMKDKHASTSSSSVPVDTPKGPSEADKAKAEKSKAEGNSQMSQKNYPEAITAYSQAIELDGTNPIYFSNRAAAYSSSGDHILAIGDAEQAIAIDPAFVRAYHRLGHAQYSLSDYKTAAESFQRGLDLDPTNAGLKGGLTNAQARVVEEEGATDLDAAGGAAAAAPANLAGMADMMKNMGMGGGAGAGAGGGGMPDLASLMQNPQMMAMAQQLMQSGGLNSMMQNPAVAQMMNQVQSGGQLPNMDEIMSNPALRDMAKQFGGPSS